MNGLYTHYISDHIREEWTMDEKHCRQNLNFLNLTTEIY